MKKLLEVNPIIGAIKDEESFERALASDCGVVFLLNGDILTIREKVESLRREGKQVFVHIDMVSGVSSSPVIVDYIKRELKVEGIITTKTNIVKKAIEADLKVIQRFFFIDSMSLQNAMESLRKIKPQAIEIMPGIMPKIVNKLHKAYPDIPIICGGLIDSKEEIIAALSAGAMAVSTTNHKNW